MSDIYKTVSLIIQAETKGIDKANKEIVRLVNLQKGAPLNPHYTESGAASAVSKLSDKILLQDKIMESHYSTVGSTNKQMQNLTNIMLENGVPLDKTGTLLEKSGLTLGTRDKLIYKVTGRELEWGKSQKIISNSIKSSEEALTKFNGSAVNALSITLPVMFGMQALGGAMQNAIDPALQMLGVQDLYNTFLAVKYLPTAEEQLNNVMNLGDAWLSESDAQRKEAGDAALAAKQMAELVGFTAQTVTLTQALGRAVPVVGESMGTIAGLTISASAAMQLFGDENTRTMATMGGLGQALSINGVDALGGFLAKLNLTKDTALPNTNLALGTSSTSFDSFGKALVDSFDKKTDVEDKLTGISGVVDVFSKNTIGVGLSTGLDFMNNLKTQVGNISPMTAVLNALGMTFSEWYNKLPILPSIAPYKYTPMTTSSTTPMDYSKTYSQSTQGTAYGYKIPGYGDFVSRPGSSPFSISPNDTLIGVKDPNAMFGGNNSATPINITVNVSNNGSTFDERRFADMIGGIVRTELSNAAR